MDYLIFHHPIMDYGSTFEYYSKRWSGEDAWDPRSHRCLCNLPDAPWLRWTHRVPPQVDPIILWCLYLHLWNVYWKGAFENIATYWYNYSQLFTFFSLVYNLLIGLLLEITTVCLESLSTLLWCIFSSQSLLKCPLLNIALPCSLLRASALLWFPQILSWLRA